MTKVRDYEEYASVYMDRHARDYYSIGAGDMQTLQDNEKAFKRFVISVITFIATYAVFLPSRY